MNKDKKKLDNMNKIKKYNYRWSNNKLSKHKELYLTNNKLMNLKNQKIENNLI